MDTQLTTQETQGKEHVVALLFQHFLVVLMFAITRTSEIV